MSEEELERFEDGLDDERAVYEGEAASDDGNDVEEAAEAQVSTKAIPEEFVEIARKYKAHEDLNDDELDLIADTAIEILRNMLGFFGADDADIDEYEGSEGELILDVSNADLAILIGRHGKTLEAFQYLFTILIHNRLGFRYPVMVDVEGYRNRRRQKLESMAHSAASRALSRGCEVRMHPMKPYERRLVHLALRKTEGVATHSEGTEPNRYVVVVPVKGGKSGRR